MVRIIVAVRGNVVVLKLLVKWREVVILATGRIFFDTSRVPLAWSRILLDALR